MSRPRLVIADDHEALRFIFKLLAEAESAERRRPDLLLMDVSMPGRRGFEAARILRERLPELRIILASQYKAASLCR